MKQETDAIAFFATEEGKQKLYALLEEYRAIEPKLEGWQKFWIPIRDLRMFYSVNAWEQCLNLQYRHSLSTRYWGSGGKIVILEDTAQLSLKRTRTDKRASICQALLDYTTRLDFVNPMDSKQAIKFEQFGLGYQGCRDLLWTPETTKQLIAVENRFVNTETLLGWLVEYWGHDLLKDTYAIALTHIETRREWKGRENLKVIKKTVSPTLKEL